MTLANCTLIARRPSAAGETRHLDALVLVTTLRPSTSAVAALCPSQTPPPNPTAAEPGDGRVLSRPSSRVHEPCSFTGAVVLRPQRGLTGSRSHRYSYGGFGGGHPHFHPHAGTAQLWSRYCMTATSLAALLLLLYLNIDKIVIKCESDRNFIWYLGHYFYFYFRRQPSLFRWLPKKRISDPCNDFPSDDMLYCRMRLN